MKKILVVIISIVALIGIVSLLNLMEEKKYNDAIERCNGKDNVITNYTNQGDKYYSCKVER